VTLYAAWLTKNVTGAEPGYDRPMAVTEREREHFRRLGEEKARSHAAAAAEHLALSMDERLARSLVLMRQFLRSAQPRDDDPSPFYDRARRLGLYRP
jgi:hypothetical protein